MTGERMISMFDPDKWLTVYDKDIRWSDKRNALLYGIEFDSTQLFFHQFKSLFYSVPMPSLLNANSHNSDYVNQTWNMKNCYLVFSCMDSENCYYGNRIFSCKNCLDCSVLYNSECCYQCIDSKNCYECFFCQYAKDCSQSYFLFDCFNCKNCFGSWNLRNKQYCIFNIQYNKEEYEEKVRLLINQMKSFLWLEEIIKVYESRLKENVILSNLHQENCESCIGWFLDNSYKARFCFESSNLHNCGYWLLLSDVKDIYDSNNTVDASLQYEVSTWWINAYNQLFCIDTRPNGTNLLYCAYCANCSDCFGCVWLQNQSYCILNKQYTKEEYEMLVATIITHMQNTWERGEFFHQSLSHFSYNDSAAFEYYPINKDTIQYYNFNYSFPKEESKEIKDSISIPDNIDDVTDDILKQILLCKESRKGYKIIRQELQFYRKYSLPIPHFHPNVRHSYRFNKKPERSLFLLKEKWNSNSMLSVYRESIGTVYSQIEYYKKIYW